MMSRLSIRLKVADLTIFIISFESKIVTKNKKTDVICDQTKRHRCEYNMLHVVGLHLVEMRQ